MPNPSHERNHPSQPRISSVGALRPRLDHPSLRDQRRPTPRMDRPAGALRDRPSASRITRLPHFLRSSSSVRILRKVIPFLPQLENPPGPHPSSNQSQPLRCPVVGPHLPRLFLGTPPHRFVADHLSRARVSTHLPPLENLSLAANPPATHRRRIFDSVHPNLSRETPCL